MRPALIRPSEGAQFTAALRDPQATQEALLQTLLRRNAGTTYGREHGFLDLPDLAAYRSRVPCVRFDEILPYVDRMLNGEPDVLFAGLPVFFARTSGTTGSPKHIPFPPEVGDEYEAALGPGRNALEHARPGVSGHALVLSGGYLEDRSPAGVPIGSASGFVRNLFADDPYFRSAPEAVYEARDHEARYYAFLRFALVQPLRLIFALNPSTVIALLQAARQHGAELLDDLITGGMRNCPGDARWSGAVGATLPAAPEQAARLREALADPSGFNPLVVWPKLEVIETWKGGASTHYLRELNRHFPGVTLRPAVSGSSEGLFMVPLRDHWQGGVPALRASVLEFLPEHDAPVADRFVNLRELDQRAGYRIVLTNGRGLYRYLMDDVFVVEGYLHDTPILRFSHRHGVTSSLTGEKLTEAHVIAASEGAMKDSALPITDYQLAPVWGEPPGYVVLLETRDHADSEEQRRWLESFERNLCVQNAEYASKRASRRLATPTLVLLREGSFSEFKRRSAGDRSDAQIKTVRLRAKLLELGEIDALTIGTSPRSHQDGRTPTVHGSS